MQHKSWRHVANLSRKIHLLTLLNFSLFFLVMNLPLLYCFYFLSWEQQAKLTSLSRPKNRTFHHSKRDLSRCLVSDKYTLCLEYICTEKKGLMEIVHAFFCRFWSPPGGWTVNKARVKAAEVQRKCLCTKSLLSSLSVRNAVQFATTFLWEIGWFPCCSRVRSFGTIPVLISSGFPLFKHRRRNWRGDFSFLRCAEINYLTWHEWNILAKWKVIIYPRTRLLPLKPIEFSVPSNLFHHIYGSQDLLS